MTGIHVEDMTAQAKLSVALKLLELADREEERLKREETEWSKLLWLVYALISAGLLSGYARGSEVPLRESYPAVPLISSLVAALAVIQFQMFRRAYYSIRRRMKKVSLELRLYDGDLWGHPLFTEQDLQMGWTTRGEWWRGTKPYASYTLRVFFVCAGHLIASLSAMLAAGVLEYRPIMLWLVGVPIVLVCIGWVFDFAHFVGFRKGRSATEAARAGTTS